MNIRPIKTRIFKEKESLLDFILEHIFELQENSILAITSKIVALAQGRTAEIKDDKTKEELIKSESELAIRTEHTWLTIKDGQPCSSAGIDASNANGKYILLPKDSFKTAAEIRIALLKKFQLKNLGIIITDSRSIPFKAGAQGVALGYAGLVGLKKYHGIPDIFGRELHVSRVNVVDSLATSAVLCMGEAAEQQPLALITDAPITFTDTVDTNELKIDLDDDLYKPLFDYLKK